jgi:glucokinase
MDSDPAVIAYINSNIKPTVEQTRKYVVGVDVGGTNTRVAIGGLDGQYVIVSKFQASTLKQLLDGLEKLAAPLISIMGFSPYAACLDIAGPVQEHGTKVEITNYVGSSGERTIKTSDLPGSLFPAGRTVFINDLESCCYGIVGLDEHKKLGEFFEPLWGAENNTVQLNPVHHAVLAAGTGLGAGLLLKFGNRNFPGLST